MERLQLKRYIALTAVVGWGWMLTGCANEPIRMMYSPTMDSADKSDDPNSLPTSSTAKSASKSAATDPHSHLTKALGMARRPADLGFAEKPFDPCRLGMNMECGSRFFTIVHFQLLCRDTEGSVSVVPTHLLPIISNQVQWKLGDQTGGTSTDAHGYGRVTVVSDRSNRAQRLILQIGPQYIGLVAGDVNRIVLPRNFCRS